MSFNHRIVRTETTARDGVVDVSFGIHEVYYREDGRIKGMSEAPLVVGNDLDDLRREMTNMMSAFDKPVIEGR